MDSFNSIEENVLANPCPAGWSFFSDYCYKFGKDANATQAEANCAKEGAHLASIHSLEEAQFIVRMFIVVGIFIKNI